MRNRFSTERKSENISYKKIIISKFGGPEVLQLFREKELPELKAGKVRNKVLKTSANFTGVMIRKGKYPDVKKKPPFSPGYDSTCEIRTFSKKVVIIAQTAFALSGDSEKAIEAGCDDYISKPVNKERLLEIISNRF